MTLMQVGRTGGFVVTFSSDAISLFVAAFASHCAAALPFFNFCLILLYSSQFPRNNNNNNSKDDALENDDSLITSRASQRQRQLDVTIRPSVCLSVRLVRRTDGAVMCLSTYSFIHSLGERVSE